MPPPASPPLNKRQGIFSEEPTNGYFSTTGYAVRYGITIAVVVIILVFFLGGYYHARFRLKNGKPLLWYHRWMIRNNRIGAYNPYYVRPGHGVPGRYPPPGPSSAPAQYYEMNGWQQPPPGAPWAPPPPAYGQHSTDVPPAYLPPPGGSKVAPVQSVREGEGSSAQGGVAQMEDQGEGGVQRPGETYSGGVIR